MTKLNVDITTRPIESLRTTSESPAAKAGPSRFDDHLQREIFQMAVLEPKLGILDETDSGLDIDALKIVAEGVNKLRGADRGFVIITHYQRLLDYIVPDFVHVLAEGRIVRSGDRQLALELEEKGYAWLDTTQPTP